MREDSTQEMNSNWKINTHLSWGIFVFTLSSRFLSAAVTRRTMGRVLFYIDFIFLLENFFFRFMKDKVAMVKYHSKYNWLTNKLVLCGTGISRWMR